MAYLHDNQRNELTDSSLNRRKAFIQRGESCTFYILQKPLNPPTQGMKSVVWDAKDDLGNDVALKIVPSTEYSEHSLTDEMTEAMKLGGEYFARILFFGDLRIEGATLSAKYKAIVIERIPGCQFDEFVESNQLTVDEFISLAEQLFSALAILRTKALCHDDFHPGNVLVHSKPNALTQELVLGIAIIDTGSIKRSATRDLLLEGLRQQIQTLEQCTPPPPKLDELRERLTWKEPSDHFRAVECLLHAANALVRNYHRLDFWERKFIDQLFHFFQKVTDADATRRLESPGKVISELYALKQTCKTEEECTPIILATPFDYISAEMIRSDREFSELFSKECPWLEQCQSLEPLYIYGPRGCGKSSVLRWLAFKTLLADPTRSSFGDLREIGIYMSCSVELRSRFWLLDSDTLKKLQIQTIRFFNLLLLEELFDTLSVMGNLELQKAYDFGLTYKVIPFTQWVIRRIGGDERSLRFQGQSPFAFLRGLARRLRWDTWSSIQGMKTEQGIPDPSMVSDVCRELSEHFSYFHGKHITFLIDDYSNQRIPESLQIKLNQTISFAKQGTPIFKVSSEYQGVNLEGIQEGREVVEINVGEKYTSLQDPAGPAFLKDILNIRLGKAKYAAKIDTLLGETSYQQGDMQRAIAEETKAQPFYYHGITCIHWLCSGDVALALDLIKQIFDDGSVSKHSTSMVPAHVQHKTIQQFSHEEVRRIKYIVPHGETLYTIVCYLGCIARAIVKNKRSERRDRPGEPLCVTHLDIRLPVIEEMKTTHMNLSQVYEFLTSRAILFTLQTSRSRISASTERLQLRRIYCPAFKAPLKRDVPIKIDTADDLVSLLSNPKTFAERQLSKSGVDTKQLELAIDQALVKPRD